jgi:hypothetical protein
VDGLDRCSVVQHRLALEVLHDMLAVIDVQFDLANPRIINQDYY